VAQLRLWSERSLQKFARQYPDLPIGFWSSPNQKYTERVFAKLELTKNRLHLDYQAVDTVTNFTTLVMMVAS